MTKQEQEELAILGGWCARQTELLGLGGKQRVKRELVTLSQLLAANQPP